MGDKILLNCPSFVKISTRLDATVRVRERHESLKGEERRDLSKFSRLIKPIVDGGGETELRKRVRASPIARCSHGIKTVPSAASEKHNPGYSGAVNRL